MSIDVARARRETPGCEHVVHLNNAGAALQPAVVTDAVVAHLRLEERIGGYEAEAEAQPLVDRTYEAIAELIGANPHEIALTDSATRAWDLAFYSLPLREGQRILTGRAEYPSNAMAMLEVAARSGATIEVVDDDEHGQIDVEDLRRRMDDDVALIALTHVPTYGGLVNPAAAVGEVAREAGVTYLLDACQSSGQIDLDVTAIGCDLMSATGRKFLRGPRGTGFLYASDRIVDTLDPAFPDIVSATWPVPESYRHAAGARRFESFEGSVAGRIGLGVAVDYALSWGTKAIEDRVTQVAATLRAALTERPGTRVHDQGVRQCGIVTFSVDGVAATEVRDRLSARGINTTVTAAGQPLLEGGQGSEPEVVRASVHYFNDDSDLDALLAALP
jgi:selenocysteine lyase/cysteine desulfurase